MDKLQELTQRLYDEGLAKGKEEGEALLRKAGAEAEAIVKKAQEEAEAILAKARKEAEDYKVKVEGDVKMAAQQSLQTTRADIENLVVTRTVDATVEKALSNEEYLKGIITEIMTSALPHAPVRIEREDLPRYYGLLRRKDDIRNCRAQTVIGARDRFTLLRDEMDEGVAKRVSELLDDYETAQAEIRPVIEKLLLDLVNLGCGRDEADLSHLSSVNRTVYGMKKPLEAIADQIFAHSRNPRVRLEPLLLCGPAGTGKTYLAMAMAVCGLFADGEMKIDNPECAAVSFPGFYETMNKAGAGIELRD